MDYSIVQFMPSRSGHSCGYCGSSDGSLSDGMWAHRMTVQDYQDLIDRGWRRSGLYCYKPKMDITCCPAYTIKCAALDVQLTKSQKKIMKRMRKFLIDGKKDNIGEGDSVANEEEPMGSCSERMRLDNVPEAVVDINMDEVDMSGINCIKNDTLVLNNMANDDVRPTSEIVIPPVSSHTSLGSEQVNQNVNTGPSHKNKTSSVVGRDCSKPIMMKAKLIRRERREKKLLATAKSQNGPPLKTSIKKSKPLQKSLEDFLNEPLPENRKHNLEIRLVNLTVPGPETERLISKELKVYQKYQVIVHHDPIEKCNAQQFTRFLVQSPLQNDSVTEGPEMGYGSFHQQYWLDGELIAVGVIDILPCCVSSVYFFYDPEYSFLSLGTYSSLMEVECVRKLNQSIHSIEFYYMGFYIHSCPKMRYKGKLRPSYLLCPEIYSWHPIEPCLPKLDKNKYSRLNDNANSVSIDSEIDLNRVLILWKSVTIDFGRYKRLCKKGVKSDDILRYAQLVGKTCSQRLLLYQ